MTKFQENLKKLADEVNHIGTKKFYFFEDRILDETKRKEIGEMEYLIDNLIVKGYHVFVFGKAGSGKTTILMHLCREMLRKNHSLTIDYFYLDGALNFAAKEGDLNSNLGLDKSFLIKSNVGGDELIKMFEHIIKEGISFKDHVIILDTYKFLSADINNKNANRKIMHLIKGLQRLGATFISIGHTNKDGKNFSGTAEIEQDSDGVLRIDSTQEGDYIISTIDKGGRCRYEVRPRTFKFKGGDILVEEIDTKIDVGAIKRYKEQYNKDINLITAVREILQREDRKLTQSELVNLCKEHDEFLGVGVNKIKELLRRYEGKEWRVERDKSNKNSKLYMSK